MAVFRALVLAVSLVSGIACGGDDGGPGTCSDVTEFDVLVFPERFFHAAPSPDGKRLAVSVRPVAATETRVEIYDIDGGEPTEVASGLPRIEHMRWDPSGEALYVRFAEEHPIQRLSLTGELSPAVETAEAWGAFDLAGDTLVHGGSVLRLFDLGSGDQVGEFERDVLASPPIVSPDGARIADVYESLRVIDVAAATETDLGGIEAVGEPPTVEWLRDGRLAVITTTGVEIVDPETGESDVAVEVTNAATLRAADDSDVLVFTEGGAPRILRGCD